MNLTDLIKAKTLVAGMGVSGLAAVELLCGYGVRPRATDIKRAEELPEAAAKLVALGIRLELQTPEVFQEADLIVISPGVPADLPEFEEARRQGARVIGEVELAGYFLAGPVIGITGSNGKTTTTALTGHILRACGIPAQVGGNIGNPPTNMVRTDAAGQWNVLELSSFQLETIEEFRCRTGVVLNVTPDHLDRHRTMEAYAGAKRRILETQQPGDAAVLNAADPICREFAEAAKTPPVWFSSTGAVARGLWLEQGMVVCDGEPLLPANEIPLRGRHNAENVMAAAAAARLAGAPLDAIAEAVRTFPGVEHRLEFVRNIGGVDYFNDSKATNVDATLKAIEAFDGRLWVILGGKDKGSDYTPLREPLGRKAHGVLLVGAAGGKISRQLGGAIETIECGTIETAAREAYRRARPGDTVLLAPACASFDQFTSFEHRGRVFKEMVASLGPGSTENPLKEATNCG